MYANSLFSFVLKHYTDASLVHETLKERSTSQSCRTRSHSSEGRKLGLDPSCHTLPPNAESPGTNTMFEEL